MSHKHLPTRLWKPVHLVAEAAAGDFLPALGEIFTELLEMDLFIIGRLADNRRNVRILFVSGHLGARFDEGSTYPLAGSPCETAVRRKKAHFCATNLNRRFSLAGLAESDDLESYSGIPLFGADGEPIGVMSVLSRRHLRKSRTVGGLLRFFAARAAAELERQHLEKRLADRDRFSQAILDAVPAPVFFKSAEGIYKGCNEAFARFIGLPKSRIIGQTVYGVAPTNLADVYHQADLDLLRSGGSQTYETSVVAADGRQHEVLFQKAVFSVDNEQPNGLVGTMIDITERREAEKTAQYLAHFDPLTNLPNQVLFLDRLNMEIANSHRLKKNFALFCLDLDHFKKVNNAFGHERGNEILQRFARRLTAFLCENDTVSKMGGDSFNLILPEVGQESHASKIALRLLEAVRQPFTIEGQEVFVHASIGIAIYPHDGSDTLTLLKNADTALHQAKEKGRNNHQFYAFEMNSWARERMITDGQLRKALERDEFILHFQPQIDAATMKLTGVEALVRWQHPTKGLLLPNNFIDLAEETGIIVPLGEWVLRTACLEARAWQDAGLPPTRIGVNLSPRQFLQPDLYETIRRILDETETDPERLSLEITENVVMKDIDHAIQTLARLRSLGVHFSIDDFGTGYSSLNYLKNLPIDMLKIDRSFVMEIPADPDDMAIVSAVISMAHNLNIKVLAEGVQSLEQKKFLQSHRCDEFQGFFFSPPLDSAALQRLMRLEVALWNGTVGC